MRVPVTLSVYIGRQYLSSIAVVLAVMGGLLFLVDIIELLRRASGHDATSFGMVIEMALLKLPDALQQIIIFAVLIGGILTLSRLTRSHELIVARSAGISVWQFLTPPVVLAFAIGVFIVIAFNPLASAMLSKYEQLEGKYLKGRASMLAVSSSGLWLRQIDEAEGGHEAETIVHALRASQKDMMMYDVTIYKFDTSGAFEQRVDAETAQLMEGHWLLDNVLITSPRDPAHRKEHYELSTNLTASQIQNSFSSPETMSFWKLPGFIETLQAAGFSAIRHELHWHAILSLPLFLCAMVFVGAIFSLKPPRIGGTGVLLSTGVFVGFMIYFLSDIVRALGLSQTLPVFLAAWAPAFISLFVGVAVLLHLEDG